MDEEISAIHQLIVKAQSMDLRAHQLALATTARGSLDGTILALVGGEGPIKAHETIEALTRDAETLIAAATKLRPASDPATVAVAREINDAAADVIAVHTTSRRHCDLRWISNARLGRVWPRGRGTSLGRCSWRSWTLPHFLAAGRRVGG